MVSNASILELSGIENLEQKSNINNTVLEGRVAQRPQLVARA